MRCTSIVSTSIYKRYFARSVCIIIFLYQRNWQHLQNKFLRVALKTLWFICETYNCTTTRDQPIPTSIHKDFNNDLNKIDGALQLSTTKSAKNRRYRNYKISPTTKRFSKIPTGPITYEILLLTRVCLYNCLLWIHKFVKIYGRRVETIKIN